MTNTFAAAFLARLSRAADQDPGSWSDRDAATAETMAARLSQNYAEGAEPVSASDAEIAAYLDGGLDDSSRDAFEAKLLASPDLREDVAALAHRVSAIDESLELPASLASPAADLAGQPTAAGLRATFVQGSPLSPQQQRALFTDLALRAEFNRLIRTERLQAPPPTPARRLSGPLSLPARIAASTDKVVNDREFPGGSIHIGSAGRPNLLQLHIKLNTPDGAGEILELTGPDGALAYLTLSPPDASGEITRIVDLKLEHEALAIELLRNPLSTGRFDPE